MARPAAESGTAFRLLRALRSPTPGRLAYALRLALICTLTVVLAESYQTPEIALTTYVVFFLNQPDRLSSLIQTLALTVVVTLVLGLLFVIAPVALASSPLRLATMVVLSFGLMFLSSASRLQGVAATVALVIVYSLDVLGHVPSGELATRALLYAWLFVGIPAGVSTVINLLLAPSPRQQVQKALAQRLRTAALALQGEASALETLPHLVQRGDAELQKAIHLARLERSSPLEDVAALQGCSDCGVALLAAVHLMTSEPDAQPDASTRTEMVSVLEKMVGIFERGGYPAYIASIEGLEQAPAPAAWRLFNAGLACCGKPRPVLASTVQPPSSGFLAKDALTDPRHIQLALKVTVAAMLCYLVYSLLNWPGIHTALITCFIVSLGTAGESIEKLGLRIVGCLLGAGCGLLTLVFLMPHVTTLGGLSAVVFAGALGGAWVAAGSPQVAYAGLQFAFAFFLCVVQGSGPAFDLAVARDRIIGILLGNLVSYVVMTRVWPVSVASHVDEALQKGRQLLTRMSGTGDVWQRWRLHAQAQGQLAEARSGLRLARLEPTPIRPSSGWLGTRAGAIAEAQAWGARQLAVISNLAPVEAMPPSNQTPRDADHV